MQRGFTFIELLVVAFIAASMLLLAIPTWADFSARHQLAAATETLAHELREARYEAVQRGSAMYVTPTPGAQWCVAVSTEPGCRCGQACVVRSFDARAYPEVAMTQAAPVRFDGRQGLSPAGPVAAFNAAGGYGTELTVSALGRARACARGTGMAGFSAC